MIDLYCGRGGWTKGFQPHGFECHGYDIADFSQEYPGHFHRQDVLQLNAGDLRREFGMRIAIICASSPCEEFTRHTMPWTRAKNPPEPDLGIKLAVHAFALAQHLRVPLIFENVRTAQRWLGKAVMHSGPFYLWGDGVPALLPIDVRRRKKESYYSTDKAMRAEIPHDLADAIARFYAQSTGPRCPWCQRTFGSWALAKPHVKHCDKAPRKRLRHEPRMGPKKNLRQGRLFE